MPDSLSILIADDHKLLLGSLASVLSHFPYIKSVRTCTNYAELRAEISLLVPDVLFLDLNLPPNNGLEICTELRETYPNLCIIILTSYTEQERIRAAKRNGANAYFIKSVDIEVVDRYLKDYMRGTQNEYTTEGVNYLAEPLTTYRTSNFAGNSLLTTREKEIAALLVSGKDHTDIMSQLSISYDTYKTHRSNILHKLGLKNIAELVQYSYSKIE